MDTHDLSYLYTGKNYEKKVEYIVGKSIFTKDEKINLHKFFDRSILNMMIKNNYLNNKNNDLYKNGTSGLGNIYCTCEESSEEQSNKRTRKKETICEI